MSGGQFVLATPDNLADLGVEIIHHFSDREYAKEARIKAGRRLVQHMHPFDHLSVLASGTAIVEIDGARTTHVGPTCLRITKGKAHGVEAVTDVVWFCIHGVDEKDPSRVDDVILGRK